MFYLPSMKKMNLKRLLLCSLALLFWLTSFSYADEDVDYTWQIQELQNQISVLSWQLNTALERLNVSYWTISSLSWSLDQCRTSKDVSYEACLEDRTSLTNQVSSLQNYSDSLNEQLQECLVDWSIQENRICDESGANCELNVFSWSCDYSFFRNENDHMYSLPVANHIVLPTWIKAYINSWSVALANVEKQEKPTIDDESFLEINELYYYFFEAVIVLWFFALFMRFIKSLYTSPFTWKNKA